MDSLFVMSPDDIKNTPKYQTVIYARMVVDYRPQKDDPNQVQMTARGNLIRYPGELTNLAADLTTSTIMCNSLLSTDGGKYMCIDINIFYLGTPFDQFEYMRIPLSMFPDHVIQQYHLRGK